MTKPMAVISRRRFDWVAHQARPAETMMEKMARPQRASPPPNRPKLTPVFSTQLKFRMGGRTGMRPTSCRVRPLMTQALVAWSSRMIRSAKT